MADWLVNKFALEIDAAGHLEWKFTDRCYAQFSG